MKKILLIDLNYLQQANANTSCLNKLLSFFDDYDITLVTKASKNNQQVLPNNVSLFPTKKFSKKTVRSLSLSNQLLILFGRLQRKRWKNIVQFKTVADTIVSLKELSIEEYDVIISLSHPIESHFCAEYLSRKYNIPWLAYYLDPFTTNFSSDRENIDKRFFLEKKMLKRTNKIVLTDPISNEYYKCGLVDPSDSRIITTKIPGIFPIEADSSFTNPFDKNYINCVFMGNLYWDIRNPIKTIEFFRQLDDRYRLYFFGKSYGKPDVKSELIRMGLIDNKKIFFMPPVSTFEAQQLMLSADVLVNIGNTSDTMIPSKIFDYISTKKTILNISKLDNDPVQLILQQYPRAISIKEEMLNHEIKDTNQKIDTLLENANDDFTLSPFYEPYTAEYVASQIKQFI